MAPEKRLGSKTLSSRSVEFKNMQLGINSFALIGVRGIRKGAWGTVALQAPLPNTHNLVVCNPVRCACQVVDTQRFPHITQLFASHAIFPLVSKTNSVYPIT